MVMLDQAAAAILADTASAMLIGDGAVLRHPSVDPRSDASAG